jgi:hypothetical protein
VENAHNEDSVEDFHTPPGGSPRLRSKKFDVAAIFEVQLKVLGIQTKLSQGPANLPGCGVIGGWPGPAFIPPLVLELEKTVVVEEHGGFVELCVGDVTGEHLAREISHSGHARYGNK